MHSYMYTLNINEVPVHAPTRFRMRRGFPSRDFRVGGLLGNIQGVPDMTGPKADIWEGKTHE